MTDQAQDRVRLVSRGVSFEIALGNLLAAAIDSITGPLDRNEADHAVRFQALADTRNGLISACLNAVMEQIDGFNRQPLGVVLDGVRPAGSGYRAWGALFLDRDIPAPGTRLRPISAAAVSETGTDVGLSIEVVTDRSL